MSLLRVTVVPSPYQVREKHLFYGGLHALGIGAASFASGIREAGMGTELVEVTVVSTSSMTRSGESEQRYSGKPDGAAGTPQDNVQCTMYN